MADKPLLCKTTGEASNKSPRKKDLSSAFLDITPSWQQSTNQLLNNDAAIPIVTRPHSSSLMNLVANLNRKRRLTHRSNSAPCVITDVREAFHDSIDPRPARKSTPSIVRFITMDDKPLLCKTTGEEASNKSPRKKDFSSALIDITPSWQQSTNQLLNNDAAIPIVTTPHSSSLMNLVANLNRKRRLTHRSNSAPCVITDVREAFHDSIDPRPARKSTPSIVRQAFIGVVIYAIIGMTVYLLNSGSFKGNATFKPVDALYFTVVTLCTIGYGDIVPDATFTKLFTCAFILVGFGLVDILLNGLVTYVLDRQEAVLLSTVDENQFNTMVRAYLIDTSKGRMRIRMKVGLALAVVIGCIAIGTVSVHFLEDMSWVDSFYLSVTSVTTVGYGDYAFATLKGRCFAIIWLLVSTLAVARAFLYLTELRIDKRNRKIAKWVLQKKMTLGDLVAADLDHDGSISKSEYIIYKLREMGKIAEKDIMQICNQFDTLDNSNCGRLTIADLMESDAD